MPKINDRVTVRWLENGAEVDEELIFYDSSSDEGGEDAKIIEEDLKPAPISESSNESLLNDPLHRITLFCLNDCLEKLVILRCVSPEDPESDFKYPEYKTIEERYGDTIEFGGKNISESKKRLLDLALTYSIISRMTEELSKKVTINSLYEVTDILKRLFDDENSFLQDIRTSVNLENEFQRRVLTEAEELDKIYKERLDDLRKLEVEHEDAIAYGTMELKYIESWEASRRHQAKIILDRKGEDFQNMIDKFTLTTKQENVIHSEIVKYFEEIIDDMQNEIQLWMERYDDEVEQRDSELLKLRMNRENQQEKSNKLKYIYEERKEFIDSWLEILEKRKKEAEELMIRTNAAIKIQAWWRGTMVRKKLGPYRKKKGKKDKGKEGKKAKKVKK